MALPGYPADDFNRGLQLLTQLGSFWTNVFQDKAILQAHLRSDAQEYAQAHLDVLEAMASLSRFTVPIFHTENWYLLTIKLSDALAVPSIYQPNDLVFGPQPGTRPGRPLGFMQTFGGTDRPPILQALLPDSLVDAPFILQNLVVFPSLTMVNGVDYEIDKERKLIRFSKDPFQNPLIAKRDIFDANGMKVDEEIALWAYQGQFDLEYVYTQFGYALGLKLQSSEGYRDILNAFWDMHVSGMSVTSLQAFLSALSGAKTILDPSETIEVVRTESTSQLIVTSSRVYRFPLAAKLTVTPADVGKVMYAGDALSDAVAVRELSGYLPDYSLLPAIALGPDFLSGGYFAELTFKNHIVALEYLGLDGDGKAVVRFESSGYPGDVETFWDFVQAQGKLPGNKTLAELLDKRTNPVGQPGPLALPATVNPMQFVLGNLMKNNLFVIRVKLASFDANAPGVSLFRLLRTVIAPHTTYLVFIELQPPLETVDLSQPGDENTPGAQESVEKFKNVSPAVEEAYEIGSSPGGNVLTYGDVYVSAKQVSLNCA